MIAMKNILIYFDYPITSIQGGTEQASFLLARLLVRQGFRIIFLSLHPFKEKNNEFLQYSLPDSEYLFSRRNAARGSTGENTAGLDVPGKISPIHGSGNEFHCRRT
mgnify:CR=1 FL=1